MLNTHLKWTQLIKSPRELFFSPSKEGCSFFNVLIYFFLQAGQHSVI